MKVTNIFANGKMDSDTHYALLDNKGFVRAENLRISGKGNDGVFQSIKGSELVSHQFSENGMVVVGAYEGADNKNYFLLAMPNQLSRVIEYDTQSKQTRLVIEDTEHLRFDLARWEKGVEKRPFQYILNINQIGHYLFISGQWWEYPRVIDLQSSQVYNPSLESIILAKKPPLKAPEFIPKKNHNLNKISEKNIFVSFAYRYKYADGSYSALSFYSDVAFEPKENHKFSINEQRENEAMVNTYESVSIVVNSGNQWITDIEVYAREHGSNTAYLIYSANKKTNNIADNSAIMDIEYKYSKNYEVLNEEATNMLFSNIPKFPKTQTVAGNRIVYGNYKEGYDLDTNVDYLVDVYTPASPSNNKTSISLFRYKVGVIFYNDYNESTTVLLPTKQTKSEVEVGFEKRLTPNQIAVTMLTNPPAFATKMKFAVMSEALNYEILHITNAQKIGKDVYIHLNKDNINRLKVGDIIFPINKDTSEHNEFIVEEVRIFSAEDGIIKKGVYARIPDSKNLIEIKEAAGEDTYYNKTNQLFWNAIGGETGDANPNRFDSTSNYKGTLKFTQQTYNSARNSAYIPISDLGGIYEGDVFKATITFKYTAVRTADDAKARDEDFETINIDIEQYADKNYDDIYQFLKDQTISPFFNITKGKQLVRVSGKYQEIDVLWLGTNSNFPSYVKANAPRAYAFKTYIRKDFPVSLCVDVSVKASVERGVIPLLFRTKNKENIQTIYYETPNTYLIQNGKFLQVDRHDSNGNPIFDIGFYNGYCWGNGVESYKIKDQFNANELKYKFRGNAYDKKGYRQVHRKYDLTYSGIYNHEMGINELSTFNPSLANWKTLPIHHGEIQRIISTDGDITVFCTDKIIQQFYGKSILMDMVGNENVGLTKEVLGDYRVLPYEFGISHNPESVAKYSDILFFTDKKRSRFLMKQGNNIEEINAFGGGFYNEGIQLLKNHQNFLGSFDETNNEYIVSLDGEKCIGFNINNKGFTSYYNYKSDYLLGAYGKHFACYEGKIYENEATENYNDFVGQGTKPALLKFVVNPEFASDKVFKAIMLQSNTAWNVSIKTNLTETQFTENAFTQKESFFYSEIYRDIATNQNLKGVSVIREVNGNTFIFETEIPQNINVNDLLYTDEMSLIGEVTEIVGKTIRVNPTAFSISPSIYPSLLSVFAVASPQRSEGYRPDGVPMRGKWLEATLTKTDNQKFYIASVNTEVIQSKL